MYTIINLLVFVVLTVMGFYYLLNPKVYQVRSAVDQTQIFPITNHQYLLLFILATAILACGAMMANRLLICIILTALSLFVVKGRFNFSIVFFFYSIFLLYLVVSWINSPVPGYGFRQFLKYLYPFLIMVFASIVPSSGQFYLKALKVILWVAILGSIHLILYQTPLSFLTRIYGYMMFWGPAIVDFLPVGLTITLVLYSYFKKKKYLLLAALFVLPSILWAWRTGILAAAITVVVFALVRYKIKALPYAALGIFILVGTVLYVPAVRDKMFVKQMSTDEIMERRDELTTDDIQSNGRFAMWEWALDTFYEERELSGSGLGSVSRAFKEELTPFRMPSAHNEYLVLLCDAGLIGIVLYGLVILSLIIHSFFIYFNFRNRMIVRVAGLIAGLSLAGMASTLYTDNVVTYSLLTLSYPFALYGMMLSLKGQ